MRILSTKEFYFKGTDLYLWDKNTGFSVKHEKDHLWRIKWPDGVLSQDYYNITWAKENAISVARKEYQQTLAG